MTDYAAKRTPNGLFVREERQQDFAFFSDQAEKCSTGILLALFEIGVTSKQ
jgi:hypothetical protein